METSIYYSTSISRQRKDVLSALRNGNSTTTDAGNYLVYLYIARDVVQNKRGEIICLPYDLYTAYIICFWIMPGNDFFIGNLQPFLYVLLIKYQL